MYPQDGGSVVAMITELTCNCRIACHTEQEYPLDGGRWKKVDGPIVLGIFHVLISFQLRIFEWRFL